MQGSSDIFRILRVFSGVGTVFEWIIVYCLTKIFNKMNEETEIWRDIEGYEGLYKVSNFGNIKNCLSGRILKLSNDKDGYKIIGLHKNGVYKTYKVHRLVAQEFIPNPQNFPFVNHKDDCFFFRFVF